MTALDLSSPRLGMLLATPLPLPSESRASWIQRIAGNHQYSMPRLMENVGYQPPHRDWDLPASPDVWSSILLSTGIPRRREESLGILEALGRRIEPSRLLWYYLGSARYRWCEQCLASDPVPFLRWHWRLEVVRDCWTHHSPLSEHCPWCASPVLLHGARLVAVGASGLASNLGHCDRCSMPLFGPRQVKPKRRKQDALQERIRQALDPLILWEGSIDGCMTDVVLRFAEVAGLGDAEIELPGYEGFLVAERRRGHGRAADCLKLLRAARSDSSWVLNSESFQAPGAPRREEGRSAVRWSWRLGHFGRARVARALRLIRSEMRNACGLEAKE